VAVYGGSFNPPHVGHGMVAAWLYWTGLVEQVWLMPAFSHPFSKEIADYEIRMRWCEAFAEDLGQWVRVTDIERHLPSPSYSIDSLRALNKAHPEHDLRFVVGSDNIPDLPNWKEWSAIESQFSPIVVGRSGYSNPTNTVVFPGVSSSEIRLRIKSGLPVEHLVTKGVLELLQ